MTKLGSLLKGAVQKAASQEEQIRQNEAATKQAAQPYIDQIEEIVELYEESNIGKLCAWENESWLEARETYSSDGHKLTVGIMICTRSSSNHTPAPYETFDHRYKKRRKEA